MEKLFDITPTWACTDSEGNVAHHIFTFCDELQKLKREKKCRSIESKQAGDATPKQLCKICVRSFLHIPEDKPLEFEIVEEL